MTPKEKAKDLFRQYEEELNRCYGTQTSIFKTEVVQFATWSVNLILKEVPMYTGELNPRWKYWQDVKKELALIPTEYHSHKNDPE